MAQGVNNVLLLWPVAMGVYLAMTNRRRGMYVENIKKKTTIQKFGS
jgi:hypothetical protein